MAGGNEGGEEQLPLSMYPISSNCVSMERMGSSSGTSEKNRNLKDTLQQKINCINNITK